MPIAIMRRLGPTGTAVLLRLSAFILLCIGVQIIVERRVGAVAHARGFVSRARRPDRMRAIPL